MVTDEILWCELHDLALTHEQLYPTPNEIFAKMTKHCIRAITLLTRLILVTLLVDSPENLTSTTTSLTKASIV